MLFTRWVRLGAKSYTKLNSKFENSAGVWADAVNDLNSLVHRPVRAIRVTRGGLEPSANFPDKLDRWHHIRNRLGRLGAGLWFNIPFKGIQDSLGFCIPFKPWILYSRKWIRILCQWNLASGFQSLVGFRIPWAAFGFQSPLFQIPRAKISRIPGQDSLNTWGDYYV